LKKESELDDLVFEIYGFDLEKDKELIQLVKIA
jgi:hypothetical protein